MCGFPIPLQWPCHPARCDSENRDEVTGTSNLVNDAGTQFDAALWYFWRNLASQIHARCTPMTQCTNIYREQLHLSSFLARENGISSAQPSPSRTLLFALASTVVPRHRHSTAQLSAARKHVSARKKIQLPGLRPRPWGPGKQEPADLSLRLRQHRRFGIDASGERERETRSADENGNSDNPHPSVRKSKVEICETRRLSPVLSLPAGISSLLAELRHVEGRPPSFGSGVLRIEVTVEPCVFNAYFSCQPCGTIHLGFFFDFKFWLTGMSILKRFIESLTAA